MNADDDPVEFPDTELVEEAPAALYCRVAGKLVWIPKAGIHTAWRLVKPGDRAVVVVSRWVAKRLELGQQP